MRTRQTLLTILFFTPVVSMTATLESAVSMSAVFMAGAWGVWGLHKAVRWVFRHPVPRSRWEWYAWPLAILAVLVLAALLVRALIPISIRIDTALILWPLMVLTHERVGRKPPRRVALWALSVSGAAWMLAFLREWLGAGEVWGLRIWPTSFPTLGILATPPGAFLLGAICFFVLIGGRRGSSR